MTAAETIHVSTEFQCCLHDRESCTDAILTYAGEHETAVAIGILMAFKLGHVQ